MHGNLLTLEEVKSHFEHWQTTRTKLRKRIPQYLPGADTWFVVTSVSVEAGSAVGFKSSVSFA